jgi:hypothetical protein
VVKVYGLGGMLSLKFKVQHFLSVNNSLGPHPHKEIYYTTAFSHISIHLSFNRTLREGSIIYPIIIYLINCN